MSPVKFASIFVLALWSVVVSAQNFPTKPVHLIVPLTPGSVADIAALAVTSEQRVDRLPGVPTIAESGYPGFKADLWIGLWSPAGVAADIVGKLSADINRALQSQEVREQFAKSGNEVRLQTSAEFALFVRDEIAANKVLVRNAGIQPE